MKTKMSSPLRQMPHEVLAAIFKIIEYHEEEPQHHDLVQLPPTARRRIIKHVKIIAGWLNDEGLRVNDLVAVLAVPRGHTSPMFVFSFDRRAQSSPDCDAVVESRKTKTMNLTGEE